MGKVQPKKEKNPKKAKVGSENSSEIRKLRKEIEKLEHDFKRTQNPRKLTDIGTAYFKLGQLDNAHAFFTKASTLEPDNPENYKRKADCLVVAGRREESLEYYRIAISMNPKDSATRTGYGHALMSLKRFEEAARIYEEALKLEDSAENNNNVGVLLCETKHFKQAAVFLAKAVEKEPRNKNFRINLAKACFRAERYNDAFFTLYDALRLDPRSAFIKSQLSSMGRHLAFRDFSQDLKDALTACLKIDNIEHQNLSVAWLRLFLMDPAYTEIHKLTKLHHYKEFKEEAEILPICTLLADDFCSNALRLLYNQAVDYEILISNLRRRLLEFFIASEDRDISDKNLRTIFKVLCALGENCFMHEYAAADTPEELARIETIKNQAVEAGKEKALACAARIALIACYGPLYKEDESLIDLARSLPSSLHSFWKSLITLQIEEPMEERRLRETIPALGSLNNEISLKVREQYEENPYPRWRYANAQEDEAKSFYFKRPYEILTAGCGTGKQVIQDRYMYPRAHITAVDLSLSSICYAKRKIQELGVDRVEFMHADILELGQLNKKFDFIMCSGVLHHMQDPEAGLKVLLSLLKPKGIMNIGLYSEYARQTVVKLRDLVAEKGWKPDREGIRTFRAYINALPADDHLRYVTRWRDYYSMSMVRDLIFHVQEHRYTFLQLDDMLKRHGLAFIDFSFIFPDILSEFIRKYPGQENYRNFKLWDEFEKKRPESFASMYQLWLCRAEDLEEILAGPKIINALEV
ncbi:MAG: methyltransferase domain-containing protein [Rhodospirillales bacterium]|nr:methyltransferase domain-containing protein [Rhodospirillales bacterium]